MSTNHVRYLCTPKFLMKVFNSIYFLILKTNNTADCVAVLDLCLSIILVVCVRFIALSAVERGI